MSDNEIPSVSRKIDIIGTMLKHIEALEKENKKAKKIIGNLYAICKDNHYPNSSILMEEAEQFLKEK